MMWFVFIFLNIPAWVALLYLAYGEPTRGEIIFISWAPLVHILAVSALFYMLGIDLML